jgi:electron transport complex protein RnfB
MARSFSKRHGAPYVIIDGCIECGICERVCPYDAIFLSDDFEYVVDGSLCPSCNRCLDPCPVDAIIPMDAPRADTIRDSNRPFVLENWQSILADQGGN